MNSVCNNFGKLVLWILFVGFGGCIAAQEPVISAQPRDRLNSESTSEKVEPYTFIYGPVDKVKHEVSFTQSIKVFGIVHRRTYEMPTDISRLESFKRYRNELIEQGGQLLYECDGKDCGRATIWGSEVFKERELSTIDRKQSYLAGSMDVDGDKRLISVYVVERANHRVFAHIVEVIPDAPVEFGKNLNVDTSLARYGFVHIEDVIPKIEGELTAADTDEIRRIAREQLTEFVDESIYVVCHLAGTLSTDELVENSQQCAESVAKIIQKELDIEVFAFGSGPFSPVNGIATSRIELVIPNLLQLD